MDDDNTVIKQNERNKISFLDCSELYVSIFDEFTDFPDDIQTLRKHASDCIVLFFQPSILTLHFLHLIYHLYHFFEVRVGDYDLQSIGRNKILVFIFHSLFNTQNGDLAKNPHDKLITEQSNIESQYDTKQGK